MRDNTTRAYSKADRRPVHYGGRAAKRRRISQEPSVSTHDGAVDIPSPRRDVPAQCRPAVASSSPNRKTPRLSSEPLIPSSTPPSSPPPATVVSSPLDITKLQKNELHQPSEPAPISSTRAILVERNTNQLQLQPPGQAKPRRMTQMRLDFGQKTRQRCKDCGMEYASSILEDVNIHRLFHNRNLSGVQLGKGSNLSELYRSRAVWVGSNGDSIIECGPGDEKSLKTQARFVLDVVDTDLGAVRLTDDQLWPSSKKKLPKVNFKAYLFVRGSKCVGLCLVEDLKTAYKVLADGIYNANDASFDSHGGTLRTGSEPEVVARGIARIWVSLNYRGQGIAIRLLDCARENAIYGQHLSKDSFAFSQPTASGVALARKWYGEAAGWRVYAG